MPKVEVISGNWLSEVQKSANSKLIELAPLPVKVEIDFDATSFKTLARDPALMDKLRDAGTKEYKKLINEGVTALRGCEAHLLQAAHFFNKQGKSL